MAPKASIDEALLERLMALSEDEIDDIINSSSTELPGCSTMRDRIQLWLDRLCTIRTSVMKQE
jgi:hypothetical protein